MCNPPACEYSKLIPPATAPDSIQVDAGIGTSTLISFNSFKDTIQVNCNAVNNCGTKTYRLKLINGTYLQSSIATITPQDLENNLIILVSSIANVGTYTVTIEGTMNTGSSTSIANSP